MVVKNLCHRWGSVSSWCTCTGVEEQYTCAVVVLVTILVEVSYFLFKEQYCRWCRTCVITVYSILSECLFTAVTAPRQHGEGPTAIFCYIFCLWRWFLIYMGPTHNFGLHSKGCWSNSLFISWNLVMTHLSDTQRSLPQHALLTLVWVLVITKLDRVTRSLWAPSRYLQSRLQSMLNAAGRLVYSRQMSEHITLLLRELHWLHVPECIKFWWCVLGYHCMHGTAPMYLADDLWPTSVARRRLHLIDSPTLLVPWTRRTTLGDCTFPMVTAKARNSLPSQIRTAFSLITFRHQTKTCHFPSDLWLI